MDFSQKVWTPLKFKLISNAIDFLIFLFQNPFGIWTSPRGENCSFWIYLPLEKFGEEEVQLLYFQAWTSWNIGKGIIEVGFGPGHLNSVARMSSPAHRGGVIGLTPTPNWPKANVHLDSTSHPVIAPASHRRTLAAAVLGTMPTGTHLLHRPHMCRLAPLSSAAHAIEGQVPFCLTAFPTIAAYPHLIFQCLRIDWAS
jgi:hypothetical protein